MIKSIHIFTLVFALFAVFGCSRQKPGQPLQVHYILGDVYVNGQRAALGQTVHNNDRLSTAAESVAEISRAKEISIRIREESEIVIHDSSGVQIDLLRGKVMSLLEKPGDYRVRTANAVAAIRGTIFFAAAQDNDNSYICCCNGNIAILSAGGAYLGDVQSPHHDARFVKSQEDRTFLEAAEMLYHDDGEIFDCLYRLRYKK